jgi:hypothetical protein
MKRTSNEGTAISFFCSKPNYADPRTPALTEIKLTRPANGPAGRHDGKANDQRDSDDGLNEAKAEGVICDKPRRDQRRQCKQEAYDLDHGATIDFS